MRCMRSREMPKRNEPDHSGIAPHLQSCNFSNAPNGCRRDRDKKIRPKIVFAKFVGQTHFACHVRRNIQHLFEFRFHRERKKSGTLLPVREQQINCVSNDVQLRRIRNFGDKTMAVGVNNVRCVVQFDCFTNFFHINNDDC